MKYSKYNTGSHILLFWSLPSISMLDVYKEKCKKLNQAINRVNPVKIITSQNKTLQLNEIGVESGRFYGFENVKGKMKKTMLNVKEIKIVILL